MGISEQVKELRGLSESIDSMDTYENDSLLFYKVAFDEAADTIESLSEKLRMGNMEREKENIKRHLKAELCPMCGAPVGRGAQTCFECGAIMDWDLLEENIERSSWIMCKDKMPEDDTWVLATHAPGLIPSRQVIPHYFQDGEFLYNWGTDNKFNSSTFGQRYMGDVIAWQPFPDPHKEKEND